MSIFVKKGPAIGEQVTDETLKEIDFTRTYLHIIDVQKGCAYFANKLIEAGVSPSRLAGQ